MWPIAEYDFRYGRIVNLRLVVEDTSSFRGFEIVSRTKESSEHLGEVSAELYYHWSPGCCLVTCPSPKFDRGAPLCIGERCVWEYEWIFGHKTWFGRLLFCLVARIFKWIQPKP